MSDTIPDKINDNECQIVNLNISKNSGTHWVCYYKKKNKCYYFNLFGLDPLLELINYLIIPINTY